MLVAVALVVQPRKVVTVAHKQFLRIGAFKSNYGPESCHVCCSDYKLQPTAHTSPQTPPHSHVSFLLRVHTLTCTFFLMCPHALTCPYSHVSSHSYVSDEKCDIFTPLSIIFIKQKN